MFGSFVLIPEDYDRLHARDPVTDAVDAVLKSIDFENLSKCLSPPCVEAFVPCLATAFTAELENAARSKQV